MLRFKVVYGVYGGGSNPVGGPAELDEVSDVHRHLVDARVVELLNVVKCALVFVSHEVDSNALTAKPTATADPEGKTNISQQPFEKPTFTYLTK